MAGHSKATAAGPAVAPGAAQAAIDAAMSPPDMGAPAPVGDDTVTMYRSDGTPAQVPASQARAAYISGQYGFAEGQTIAVQNRGRVLETDAANAAQVLGGEDGLELAGNRQLDAAREAKQFGGVGQGLKAVGAGAARGLTFGLSDVAATQFGGESARQELAGLKEHRGVLSGAGEVGGMLLPLALSGGAAAPIEGAEAGAGILGGAARVAGALPRGVAALGEGAADIAGNVVGRGATSLVGRVAQKAIPMAAGGALEGAAYGAGQTISEAALGDEELTAEKLLAGAGHGALIGGVAGGALGAISAGGKYALEKLAARGGEGTLGSAIENFADKQTIRALGAKPSDITKLGADAEMQAERLGAIAKEVRNYRFGEGGEKLLTLTDSAESMAPKLQRAVEDTGQKLGKLREQFDAVVKERPDLAPDMGKFFSQLDEHLAPMKASPLRQLQKRAENVENTFADLRTLHDTGTPVGFKELYQVRRDLDGIIYPGKGRLPPKSMESLLRARGALEGVIEESADKAAAATGDAALSGQYQATKATFRNLKDAERIAGRDAVSELGRRVASPSDYGVGMAGAVMGAAGGHGGIASAVQGGVLGMANSMLRHHGNAVLATAADAVLNLGKLKALTNAVDSKIADGVKGFIANKATAEAIRHGSGELSGKVESRAVQAATAAAILGKTSHEAVHQQLQHVAELNSDPEKMAAHTHALAGNIGNVAPKVAAQVAMKDQQRIRYLDSVAPRPSSPQNALIPQMDTLRYKDADVNRWLRTKALVYNPTLIVDELNRGTINKSDVDAVKATSPKLFDAVLGHVKDQLADPKTKVPYAKRIRLGILFGFPADQTQTPEFAQFVGNTYAGMAKEDSGSPGPQRGAGGHPHSRNIQPDMAMVQTASQSVEAGGIGQ